MSDLSIIEHPSPNFTEREKGAAPNMLMLHYTGMVSGEAALKRLCDPAAEVSSHYLIEEDGRIFRLVPDDKRAHHAGISYWRGEESLNRVSIGIELVNPGHEFGLRPFPEAQMAALKALCHDLIRRHGIQPPRILGHSDVAPDRKQDPGELFDWQALARDGIGLWPVEKHLNVTPDMRAAMEHLRFIGYKVGTNTDNFLAVKAFQRRYRPSLVDGILDDVTFARMLALVEILKRFQG